MRVKIKRLPQARTGYQVQGALVNDVPAMGGVDYNAYIGMKKPKVGSTLTKVPRDKANLEAEGGETVIGNIDGSGMPSFYTIEGPRHHSGGVPLNLPDDSFIFSDTQSMKISDPVILKMFNKPAKKGGYTPAELSKPYDLNKYRKILQDPDSDDIARKTAELMIKNYTIKLGALALAQEAKKGFPQGIPVVAEPYMEANKITPEQVMPELAVQRQQMEQQPQENEGQEPNIEPEAQEEMATMEPGMSPDQMGMSPDMLEESPMAMYGMQMGGYTLPFYNDPTEMAYGGLVKYQKKGEVNKLSGRALTGDELKKAAADKQARKVKQIEQGYEDIGGGKFAKGTIEETAGVKQDFKVYKGSGKKQTKAEEDAYLNGICKRMRTGDLRNREVSELVGKFFHPNFASRMQKCVTMTGEKKQNIDVIEKEEEIIPEDSSSVITTPEDCNCTDEKTGEKYTVGKDENNNCLPCTKEEKKCKCPDGSDPGMNDDGTCKDCETEEEEVEQETELPTKPEAEWWLQDTVNTMGAFGDLMSTKKYMPWEARVDLEEPRPTFLDPTRELAAQSEQANIAAQATASFAGPQALGARLSAIQGQGATQAANTLSNINNQNVNIANQFEANQVGVRNQEQMLNQQMANRLYDKNTIANQQFDNAIRQGRANMRNQYNTAVTNKWKTDALNQMYPNYQTRPGVGGRVTYTPTDKSAKAEKPEQTEAEYYKDLIKSGLPAGVAGKRVIDKFKSKKGGRVQRGYIYTDWPIFL
jgi:hypothetical protein